MFTGRAYSELVFIKLITMVLECHQSYMRDADSGDCVACPKGTYSDTVDVDSCSSCPEGQTTVNAASYDASLCYGKIQANTAIFASYCTL